MNKIEEFRYNVLEKLRQAFDSLGEAAILRDPAEGLSTHMLNVLHTELGTSGEEIMGEYYFLPVNDENTQFHLFSSVLTLSEEMPEERFEIMCNAANVMNFFLPAGSLVFSKQDGIMAYKFNSLIPGSATEDQALVIIDGNIGLVLNLMDKYADAIMKLLRDEINFEDVLDLMPDAFRM
jgi:hypothetical protein